jgi:nicotinamidase-related amidase
MPSVPPRLEKDKCCLIVIDMQERFRGLIQRMPAVTAGCSRLIRFCDKLGVPMLVTEHYRRGLGETLGELHQLIARFDPLQKITFSCALDESFQAALTALARPQIVLCGIETHVCVYQTAYDLLNAGQQVVIAVDAVSSRRAEDRQAGLEAMRDLGARLMSVEMIMFEILKKAQTDDFKLVADILKEG